jgi:NSS family neurotransmitter:Na+ symporter
MRPSKPTPWSLNRASDVRYLALGSAVGIGNFFFIPAATLNLGGLSFFLAHVLGLAVLGSALLLAEFYWARWLQRSFVVSYRTLDSKFTFVPFLSFLAVSLITPAYLIELGRLLILLLHSLSNRGFLPAGERLRLEQEYFISFVAGFAVLATALACLQMSTRKVLRLVKAALSICFISWFLLSAVILQGWGRAGLESLLVWHSQRLTTQGVLSAWGFSLFSLSAGFGVLYTYIQFSGYPSLQNDHIQFWRRPGQLLKIVAFVVAGDLLASVFSVIITSPFANSANSNVATPLNGATLLLDWLPQILVRDPYGSLWVALLFSSLLLAGLCSAMSLLEFEIYTMELELKWSRRRASTHVLFFSSLTLLLPLIPEASRKMSRWGSDILMPLCALFLVLFVGWKMPRKAHVQLLGRGHILDSVLKLWRLTVRYLIPVFLIYYLTQSILL